MVGVPGKFKGCNTCRLRRVKCDNTRPFCKKCIDSGRTCAGYERETVFIIGTIEDGGRCSSHPPRVVKSSKKASKVAAKVEEDDDGLELIPSEPLQPAWDDLISISNYGKHYRVQLAALHTSFSGLVKETDDDDNDDGGKVTLVTVPRYEPPDVRPSSKEEDFTVRSQCLVHLSSAEDVQSEELETTTDSICLFLYEHNNSAIFTNQAPWRDPVVQNNMVRRMGPESFRAFPNHHFFARVYRHNAINAALLNRKPTFLSGPEWINTPWENHPKSFFDRLFDKIVLLPSLFARADRIIPVDPTLPRRLQAQDLLANCLDLENQLDAWYTSINPNGFADHSQIYWIEDSDGSDIQIPFADPFAFRDSVTALALIYYWTILILLYPCIERLHECIFQPVVDAFPQIYPVLPRNQQIDHLRYSHKEVRELAANVCRSLDFALNATVQPDMLVVPLFVVQEFYREINISAGDGQLELIWCEAFRQRLLTRGQDIVDVIQSRKWHDLTAY